MNYPSFKVNLFVVSECGRGEPSSSEIVWRSYWSFTWETVWNSSLVHCLAF